MQNTVYVCTAACISTVLSMGAAGVRLGRLLDELYVFDLLLYCYSTVDVSREAVRKLIVISHRILYFMMPLVRALVCWYVYIYQVGLNTPCGIATPSLPMMTHDGW